MSRSPQCAGLILLALEKAYQREIQASCLAAAGFAVMEVVSTDEALSALESRRDVRILVVEPMMPGCLSGLALSRFVDRHWPRIRTIILGWPAEPIPSLPLSVSLLPDTCPPSVLVEVVHAKLMESPHMA